MNATTMTNTITPKNKFMLLLKRELWENRGGFIWAPIIVGIIACAFMLLGIVGGSMAYHRAKNNGDIDIQHIQSHASTQTEEIRKGISIASDVFFMSGIGMCLAVMIFVIFFYALGSLYDERRDRSVLFWKSLPVSDTQTVLSKVTWALILAPVVSTVIGLCVGLILWLMATAGFYLNDVPGAQVAFSEARPLSIFATVVSSIPVYAFWALPTIGWLMLCSAWARRFPFIWAVAIPVLACAMISMMAGIFGSISGMDFPFGNLWYTVVYRGLLSIVPGTWYANEYVNSQHFDSLENLEDFQRATDFTSGWSAFATIDMWVGVAIGVAMIFAAIRLRRWRDEG